jgi:hypothetical protein
VKSKWLILAAVALISCSPGGGGESSGTGGTNNSTGSGKSSGSGSGDNGNNPGGPRVARRLSAEQLDAALEIATGERWTGEVVIKDSYSYTGVTDKLDADLLDIYAASLGRPDYNFTVRESREATVTFSKYAEDAARATCTKAAVKAPSILEAEPTTDEASVRRNLADLILRFWGERQAPDSAAVTELLPVHTEGAWLGICVALATHPKFLTY